MGKSHVALDVEIPSDVRYIDDVIELATRKCRELRLPPHKCSLNVRVALAEAISNAILRGNGESKDKHVRIRAVVSDESVVFDVVDEGPGFGDEDAPSLFELFYRADAAVRRASGAGIGLYACRELVTAMGGRIWARSRPEGGAEFGFALRIFVDEA